MFQCACPCDSSLPVVDLSLPCCCIISVRKPTSTQAIAEDVATSPRESDNQRLWVEQGIGVLGRSTPDNLVSKTHQVAFIGVNCRTKEEESRRAAMSKGGHRNLQKSGTACIPQRAVLFQRRVLYDRLVQQCIIV